MRPPVPPACRPHGLRSLRRRRVAAGRAAVLATVVASAWGSPAAADGVGPPATLDAALARIAELEARVAELEARLAAAGQRAARLETDAAVVPRAERTAAAAARFTSDYDAGARATRVTGPVRRAGTNLGLSNARFLVAAAFVRPGPPDAPPDAPPRGPVDPLELYVATRGHTNDRLRRVAHATLTLDGVPAGALTRAEYVEEARRATPAGAGRARRGVVTYDERLRFTLDRATAVRMAHAGRGRLDLGGVHVQLDAEHLAAVRALLLRSAGEVPAP